MCTKKISQRICSSYLSLKSKYFFITHFRTTVSPKKKVKVDKEKENVSIKENEEDTPEEKAVTVEKEEEVEKDMPVPQVKIGPDGSIILNEERYKNEE